MSRIFERQLPHALALAVLAAGLFAVTRGEPMRQGSCLGFGTETWLWLAAGIGVAHQVYVWFCWRFQLHRGLLTRVLGQRAFPTYALIFAVLILARPLLLTVLAVANANTLPVDPALGSVVAGILTIPWLYLGYSVHRYFGFRRATGADHFDPSLRNAPLVRDGIFRWTPNAMYVFGFLILWVIAILLRSQAALAVAGFSHAYIWVHYFCTERPDMARIYGRSA